MTDKALVSLQFDHVLLNRTAHAATLFKLLADGLEALRMFGNTLDDSYDFTAPAFGFATDGHNAISGYCGFGCATYASGDGALALWAQFAPVGAVYRPGIAR